MRKYGSFFSGGGLADIGAKMAGYDLTFANEIDPAIAAVYRQNLGDHIIVGNVLDLCIDDLPYVDLFHASPVCTRASIANKNRGEAEIDIATARKVAEYIRTHKPATVTIENVSQYRDFKAYALLIDTLDECGYWHTASIENMADYGVPQTRRRLIVRAVRGGFVPYLPPKVKWVGWYQAIEDLIDTLPDDRFADWQIARLPKGIGSRLFTNGSFDGQVIFAEKEEPANTITANTNQTALRAFIYDSINYSSNTVRTADMPVFTTTGYSAKHQPPRAFIVDGQTIVGERMTIREGHEPLMTLTASNSKHPARAWLSQGRVVRMTPRCGARFMSVSDWYVLPDKTGLAWKILGNGVPSLFYQRVAEAFGQYRSTIASNET